MRKTWEDNTKYVKGQVKSQQKLGGHFVGKPSEQGQAKSQILEGKDKVAGKSSWSDKICFNCHEKGHIASQCHKTKENKEILPQKMNLNKAKSVYCIQNDQIASPREEPVVMETPAEGSTIDTFSGEVSSYDDNLPIAEIRHCLYIRIDSQLFESAGDNIGIFENNYLALRDTCSQVTLCHPDIIPQRHIIPNI